MRKEAVCTCRVPVTTFDSKVEQSMAQRLGVTVQEAHIMVDAFMDAVQYVHLDVVQEQSSAQCQVPPVAHAAS